jgi:hypothetical protein
MIYKRGCCLALHHISGTCLEVIGTIEVRTYNNPKMESARMEK